MAEYTNTERKLAGILNNVPYIKNSIKYTYQYISSLFFKSTNKYLLHPNVALKVISKCAGNSFWGYYDKTPQRNGNNIYHCSENFVRPNQGKKITIILNNEKISRTNAWNWQQGSKMCWLNDKEIIHNLFNGENYISRIINIRGKTYRNIDFPIYSVSKNGTFSISLNFSRLAKLRPDYGYFNIPYQNIPKSCENDGLFFVDLEKNSYKLILSLEDLKSFQPNIEMQDAWHKVNHIDLSPDGKRFMFLHRWINNRGVKWSRLLTANIDGSGLYCLADEGMVSHCTWKNNKEIIGWLRKNNENHYYLMKDQTPEYDIIGKKMLNEDGHPSVSKNEEWLLTDTYPNRTRMSKLLLFNLKDHRLIEVGQFYSSLKYYGFKRCDLHPRFNEDNAKITFDSVFSGRRQMYELDISGIINEK